MAPAAREQGATDSAMLARLLATERITGALPQPASLVQRVAVFSEAFLPKVDGVTRSALLTIRYLRATGRAVTVFAPSPCLTTLDDVAIHAIPSLPMPLYPETRVAPLWLPALGHLRAFRPDLIHLFSPFGLGSLGMVAGGWLGVPVIANYQTDLPAYAATYGHGYLRRLIIAALAWLHNGCTLTLAPTGATIAELRRWGFRRLRRWERGIDLLRFNPAHYDAAWRQRLLNGRDPSRMIALYVGRLAPDKHIEILKPLAADPRIALTLIGDGSHRAQLDAAFADTDAFFMGAMVGDDLARAYAAADVFAFPGPEETFGQVVLEAMASGLPVVVTDRGGPASLVHAGETGFIVPVDDAQGFIDRVCWLRDNHRARRAMGQAARAGTESRPWLAIMEQLEGHYTEAVRLHQRRSRRRAYETAHRRA
jgi:phosphatidylinositol alpha 1,6-mannosyltransferase